MNKTKSNNMNNENNGYKEVRICDLESDALTSDDYLAIKKLAKRLWIKNLFLLGFVLFFLFSIAMLVRNHLGGISDISLGQGFMLGILTVALIYVMFLTCHEFYCLRGGSFKKAKYGIIEKKFSEVDSDAEGLSVSYYADVVFPCTNKRLNRVNCEEKTYKSVIKGDRVLVVSFDN